MKSSHVWNLTIKKVEEFFCECITWGYNIRRRSEFGDLICNSRVRDKIMPCVIILNQSNLMYIIKYRYIYIYHMSGLGTILSINI